MREGRERGRTRNGRTFRLGSLKASVNCATQTEKHAVSPPVIVPSSREKKKKREKNKIKAAGYFSPLGLERIKANGP